MSTLYVHAALGRSGLGNMLVPWAWAEVFRARHGVPMLAPQWTQPKIGPILRRERDLRFYAGLFDNSGYVRGLRRLAVLLRAERVSPEAAEREPSRPGGPPRLVVYRFIEISLTGLGPHRELLSRRLNAILSRSVRARLEREPPVAPIVMHVRRGDRPPLPYGVPFGEDQIPGMPDEWFIGALRHLREIAGREVPATVFTDAPAERVLPILALPGVTLAPPNPSIVDMLLLARGAVLVGTGSSSFTAWASLLGGMPTLCYPGLLERIRVDYAPAVRTELDGRVLPADVDAVRMTLRAR